MQRVKPDWKPHRYAAAIAAWAFGQRIECRYRSPEATEADWRLYADSPNSGRPNWDHPELEWRAALWPKPTAPADQVDDFIAGFLAAGGSTGDALSQAKQYASCVAAASAAEVRAELSQTEACPFCGSRDSRVERGADGWLCVRCLNCGAQGPCIDLDGRGCLARWNARVSNRPPGEQNPG